MSTTIDQRVVEMRFDNKQFESNVSTTMSTLDKLKQSLNLTGAAKGFDNISTAARGVNLSGLSGAVDAVQAKFSALQVMGITALSNITNSAVNAGKRIVSALTIDPIKTGFSEYETQINAVQTILANTKSKGTTIDDVNGALDELNAYADKTIYNFTEMTRNIGTFTAAGVDLDKSVSSIKGIANLAAVSGSTSQQASTAMYQLSQALAAGKVQLMDWNSVVNAGMGGEVFQTALKRTAKNMGYNVDAMIEKYGSFRESLTKGEWLTADVLTETLTQLSGAYTKADLLAQGYTEKQAEEILELADTAESAATDVKTFTQLFDTLKEAAQSGWSQTWEILVGDFEEAKELFSKVSDVIGKMIGDSANARNELLQGWKDAGGRADLIDAVSNAFAGLMNIVKPIKEAFSEIFPPMTVDQLVNFTKGLKELTGQFKDFTSTHGDKIKSTFKGIFSVLDIGWTIIKELGGGVAELLGHFGGLGGGILDVTGSFGDWLTNLRDTIKETDIFGKAIDKIVGFLTNAIDYIKQFGKAVKESLRPDGLEGFLGFFTGLWNVIKTIGSKAREIFAPLGQSIANAFSGFEFGNVLNTGLFAGILAGLNKFVWGLSDPFEGVSGILENVKGILDDVRGCFEAYQQNLQAGTLLKIAAAIGILAAAILIIGSINPDRLDQSLGAITVLFVELLGSLAVFTKISGDMKGVVKASTVMISMSVALVILAAALKTLSTIEPERIAGSLVAIGVLMAELAGFIAVMSKINGKITGTAVGILVLSAAMLVMAKAVEDFGDMEWSEIGKGLAAIGGLLLELALFTKLAGGAKHVLSTGTAMVLLGASMKIFASAVKDFSGMKWEEIGRGLAAMAGALAAVTIAMKFMPKNSIGLGVGLIAVGAAMKILASSLSDFGGMSWDEIGRGLVVMGGALAELTIALKLMNGTLAGSAALIIAAGALAIIAPVMKSLGGMSWGEIARGLVALAGAFAVIGVAGLLLGPLVPTILGLAAAFALFGVAALGIGVGIAAVAAGISLLATAGTIGATAFVASLSVIIGGVVGLIPEIVEGLGKLILATCTVIAECAPAIADTILVVITEVLASLATYTPQIVDSLFTFVIGLMDALATRLPEFIASAMNLIGAFFQGVVDALKGIDTSNLIQGIVGVGLLSALMLALSAISGLIPGAMAGVLGMGIVIAELALVLAAIGALAQIPGLEWLIGEGGDFLQKVGNAIGQFVGGIAGGIAEGFTDSLPQIGTDLATFMTNIQPFIDGAKAVDASMMEGVNTLAKTIMTLTAADLLSAITSWITGGNSLGDFAEQLVPFGKAMKEYSNEVQGLDTEAVAVSASAAKDLVAVAKAVPGDGLFGFDGIDDFGKNIVEFGSYLKEYGTEVKGIDSESIKSSAETVKNIVSAVKTIPDDGIFGTDGIDNFGDNLVSFAKSLKKYSDNISDVNTGAISSSIHTVREVITLINSMVGLDSSGAKSFRDAINDLSKTNIDGFVKAFKTSTPNLTTLGTQMIDAITKGLKSNKVSLTNTATTLVDSSVKVIKSKVTQFRNVGIELMTKFIDGIKGNKEKATSTMKSVASSMVTITRGYYDEFYGAGSHLVTGFANGISANSYKAAAKARAMAAAAAKAAKEELQEHSPSKVGYGIGDYFGIAFVNGIGDNIRKAQAASTELAASAKNGLRDSIGKITDVINSSMDMQPTIRPVVDLSDVKSGINTIDNMMGLGMSLGVLGDVGSISTMMNRRQNGTNDNVVSAIKDLGRKIDKLPGNTYSFGDITYDDGTNISNAVQSLVRAARMERRT